MTPDQSILIAAADVRRALVQPGDIRAEVEFQNDINSLLARIDDEATLEAVAAPAQPDVAALAESDVDVLAESDVDVLPEPDAAGAAGPVFAPPSRALRVIYGGVDKARPVAQPPPFRYKMTG